MKASEAKKLSDQNNPKLAVEAIVSEIQQAASQGFYTIKMYRYGFGDSSLYDGESKWTKGQAQIAKSLRNLGYSVRQWAELRQFADIYLEISWDKD